MELQMKPITPEPLGHDDVSQFQPREALQLCHTESCHLSSLASSKQRFTTSLLWRRCLKAVLGVCQSRPLVTLFTTPAPLTTPTPLITPTPQTPTHPAPYLSILLHLVGNSGRFT